MCAGLLINYSNISFYLSSRNIILPTYVFIGEPYLMSVLIEIYDLHKCEINFEMKVLRRLYWKLQINVDKCLKISMEISPLIT